MRTMPMASQRIEGRRGDLNPARRVHSLTPTHVVCTLPGSAEFRGLLYATAAILHAAAIVWISTFPTSTEASKKVW